MKYQFAFAALASLVAASPITDTSSLSTRQIPVTPAPGSPESYAQAASILGSLAQGLKGTTGIPFGNDAASALQGLANGLGSAGQVAGGKKSPTLSIRQTPAPGSPESFAQAAAIIGGLAKGLKGQNGIPFGSDAASALDGLAKGLGSAGQAAAGKGGLKVRQTPAPGSPESYAEAAAIIGGLAQGLKGSGIPYGNDASAALAGIAKGLGGAGKGARI